MTVYSWDGLISRGWKVDAPCMAQSPSQDFKGETMYPDKIQYERLEEVKESDFKYPVFFFGYGSLMYPKGINGRGMKVNYTADMLNLCRLENFQRGSYAVYNGEYYYSMKPEQDSVVTGVIFRVDDLEDLNKLLIDEGAHKMFRKTSQGVMYDIAEVSNLICDIYLPEKVKVYTLIAPTHKKVISGTMNRWYIRHVFNGIQMHGDVFVNEFLTTGGEQLPRE